MTIGRGMLQGDAATIWGAGSRRPKRGSGSAPDRLRQFAKRPTTFPPCRNGPATVWEQAKGNPSRHHLAPPAMTAATLTAELPTVTIEGIIYQIIKEKDFTVTPEMVGWCETPTTRQWLTLKRPRGKRFYNAVRYESGKYSSVA